MPVQTRRSALKSLQDIDRQIRAIRRQKKTYTVTVPTYDRRDDLSGLRVLTDNSGGVFGSKYLANSNPNDRLFSIGNGTIGSTGVSIQRSL